MSGTSLDGIDASLVECHPSDGTIRLLHHIHRPYPEVTQQRLRRITDQTSLATMLYWHNTLPENYADAVSQLLATTPVSVSVEQISAIGCHGQTVWHNAQAQPPVSLQLGNPSHLAELTGIRVVADFRQRDLAAGGKGAPLAPLFHRILFSGPRPRAVLNLGGIANLSILNADDATVSGFDCGPASTLLDALSREFRGKPFDNAGRWAASGQVNGDLLEQLLQDPFFTRPPPRSTGPEYFNLEWLKPHLPKDLSAVDMQATLSELSAQSIALALRQWGQGAEDLIITGGGARNLDLVERIQTAVSPCTVTISDAWGFPAEAVESIGFGWLAYAAVNGIRHDLSAITGAPEPLPLGGIYPA